MTAEDRKFLRDQWEEEDWFPWEDEGWIKFHVAVKEIEALGLSRGVAERTLRVLCGSGDIRSICHDSMDCESVDSPQPVLIDPGEWRETGELDLHGKSVNRLMRIEGKLVSQSVFYDLVRVSEEDFRHWLKEQKPTKPEPKQKSTRPRDIAGEVIEAIWPKRDIPKTVSNAQIEQQVGKRLKELGRSEISSDTILRAAGRK
jgi:hypothetical protein